MSAPNILALTSILGKAATLNLTSTAEASLLSNAASSGKLLKVNSIVISNGDTSAVDVTVSYHSAAAIGGTATAIAAVVSVPAKSTLVVVDANTCVYLEEDRSIGVTAAVANKLKAVASYEELS